MSDGTIPGKPIRIYEFDGSFNDFSTEDVVSQKLNSFVGWKCAAGIENLCISFDGDVQSASCGSIGKKGETGKYGNIFETFQLDNDWITCGQKFCSCGADLFIPKVQDNSYLNLLNFTNGTEHSLEKRTVEIIKPAALERTFAGRNKQVFWEIGRRCNYDCSYCHPFVHNNYEAHKTLAMLKYATENLEQKFSKGSQINFAISGGEPTLNPDYLDWVKYLFGRGHRISTHSNGTRPTEYYTELITLSDINISVHFEHYQKAKMIPLISTIASVVHDHRISEKYVGHLEVMLMIIPGRQDEVLDFEKEIWKIPHFREHCTLTVMPIRGHESIDAKEERSGDVLVDYPKGEADNFGSRRPDPALHISLYDLLDKIKDPQKRKEAFQNLNNGLNEKE